MKLVLERATLLKVLGHVQSVVERRNTIPILGNVMITAESGSVTMTATDLDIQATETAPAQVEIAGATTVPAHTFHDIVRKMPDGCMVQISVSDEKMIVASGRSRFTLPILPSDDFPLLANDELPIKLSLPSETLSAMFGRARYAISTEETRYYLNGIFFHSIDDTLFSVSTDGHRLVQISIPHPEGTAEIAGIIVPRKCVSEVLKVVDDIDGEIHISLSETKIRFEIGNLVYTSKLIDGTYPDYARVIPTTNDKDVLVDAKALAEAIDRVATITTERTRSVKVKLKRNELTLSVTSPETGLATETVDVEYDGEPLEIGFNARYLLDVLLQDRDGEIKIAFKNPSDPVLFTSERRPGDLGVVMPTRV